MHSLHVFNQLVRNLKNLFTELTGQELAGGFMLPDVYLEVEGFGEGDHALLALQLRGIPHVVRAHMVPRSRMV